ncbi:MAG: radical SAM protein [Candidatus Sumerlaeia bacterium]|nr:radical SAM protein [Candidatus Sumerlaeia bacterium]
MKPSLIVHEICLTLQGESTQAGRLCVLVRLAGCPQSCRYCDTPQARPFDAGRPMTIEEIIGQIEPLQCRLVEITGGEPLAQPATADLARALIEHGFEVMVETSGSHAIEVLPPQARRIMDLKCPSSGECERNDFSNIEHLTPRDEVKFVLADRRDYEWARDMVRKYGLTQRCEVLFSPVCERLVPRQLAEWIIADRLPVRLQIQLHKYIWGNDARGV